MQHFAVCRALRRRKTCAHVRGHDCSHQLEIYLCTQDNFSVASQVVRSHSEGGGPHASPNRTRLQRTCARPQQPPSGCAPLGSPLSRLHRHPLCTAVEPRATPNPDPAV